MATDYTTLEIECPECGSKSWHEIEYLIGTGLIPRTSIECENCREELTVSANLELDVELTKAP